jgi:hypothetical protein
LSLTVFRSSTRLESSLVEVFVDHERLGYRMRGRKLTCTVLTLGLVLSEAAVVLEVY